MAKNYSDRDYLIENISPHKGILYWKYVENASNRMVKEFGNRELLKNYKTEVPKKGFFVECLPGYCFSFIIYIDSTGLNYVTDENSLRKFIGRIDNVSEAILIGMTEGLWIDNENEQGGSYKESENGYELQLLKYNGCPETYESVLLQINLKGDYKTKSNGVYKKTGNCIDW